ncbi:DNA phosphorothioation system sulfurtransferase DndC [Sandarakinorhabdus limnophila]|uniref:DNA phosphorothioation system sulfurtransferase DndC n=1 Tax=Sandarakinorhabdus limnophila TaxID=210512 RepID=UPI0031383DD3
MDGLAEQQTLEPTLLDHMRADILDEYNQEHSHPWIIGFSGGKDSTLVMHLVFEALLSLPPSARRRTVHVVANDTLVESPLVVQHMVDSVNEIGEAAQVFGLPIVTQITRPKVDQTFWVNVIGRGYPPPNRSFRWCTDRMKISPTSKYIKEQVDAAGRVILLLGVRRSESSQRSASVGRYDTEGRLHQHNDLQNCMVFRPIVEMHTDQVWDFLGNNEPPWGGTHLRLIGLYRKASGGECPVVTSMEDIPSCGTSSSRFGCWTCTVVEKDRSLEGFVEWGHDEFGPLLDFRDWLASIRNDPNRRQARRRDGRITVTTTGALVPGPFTFQTRSEIFDRLRETERQVGHRLLADDEIELIYSIWNTEMASQGNHKSLEIRQLGGGALR